MLCEKHQCPYLSLLWRCGHQCLLNKQYFSTFACAQVAGFKVIRLYGYSEITNIHLNSEVYLAISVKTKKVFRPTAKPYNRTSFASLKLAKLELFPEPLLQPLHAFHTEYGDAAILKGLCHAEQHEPQHAFQLYGYWQRHLGEGEYVAGNTTKQDYHSCAE